MLERALALSDGAAITADDLQFAGTTRQRGTDSTAPATAGTGGPAPVQGEGIPDFAAAYGNLEGYLGSIEKQILSKALVETCWNRSATAKLLGIGFRSQRYRLKKLGLEE